MITDLGVLEPDQVTRELVLTQVHPGVTFADVQAATGWELRAAPVLETTAPPTDEELRVLRALESARPGAPR